MRVILFFFLYLAKVLVYAAGCILPFALFLWTLKNGYFHYFIYGISALLLLIWVLKLNEPESEGLDGKIKTSLLMLIYAAATALALTTNWGMSLLVEGWGTYALLYSAIATSALVAVIIMLMLARAIEEENFAKMPHVFVRYLGGSLLAFGVLYQLRPYIALW